MATATRSEAWLLWAGLALAFSPVLLDLAGHLQANPWARYALAFPLLFVRCARREARRPRSPAGSVWIAAGLALEVAAAFAGGIRWGRPGIALAALGVCQHLGLGSWRSRLLLLLAVPIPAFLVGLGSRELSWAQIDLVLAGARALGLVASHTGGAIVGSAGVLLRPNEEWLALAPLLAGLAWYAGALLRQPLGASLLAAAAGVALAWPLQTLALALALGMAVAGWPDAAQVLLLDGTWIAVAVLGVVGAERRCARRAAR